MHLPRIYVTLVLLKYFRYVTSNVRGALSAPGECYACSFSLCYAWLPDYRSSIVPVRHTYRKPQGGTAAFQTSQQNLVPTRRRILAYEFPVPALQAHKGSPRRVLLSPRAEPDDRQRRRRSGDP